MILVVGGLAAGKREYVKKCYGYMDEQMANAQINEKPVIYNLQNLVELAPKTSMELLPALLEKEVVICNEVGCGIVPMQASAREAREATARLCIELAAKAEKVVRICCGLPVIIKG